MNPVSLLPHLVLLLRSVNGTTISEDITTLKCMVSDHSVLLNDSDFSSAETVTTEFICSVLRRTLKLSKLKQNKTTNKPPKSDVLEMKSNYFLSSKVLEQVDTLRKLTLRTDL
jgi:hypothetical protein